MAMDIVYGGFSFRSAGLAVPLVSLNTQLSTTEGGYLVGGVLSVTLDGKIVADGTNDSSNYTTSSPGYDPSNPDPWGTSLATDMARINSAFSKDYRPLYISCGNTNPTPNSKGDLRPNTDIIWDFYQVDPLSTKIISSSFTNNTDPQWMHVVDYSINLEVDITGATEWLPARGGPYFVTNIQDTFNITPMTDRKVYLGIGNGSNIMDGANTRQLADYATKSQGHMFPFATGDMFPEYTITRTISAQGRATKPSHNNHQSTAVQNAKHFVTGMLFFNNSVYGAFNNLRISNRNTIVESSEADGTYSISDTFQAFSGENSTPYTDVFNISCTTDRNFLRTVTIDGQIRGYDSYVENSNKLYWDMTIPAADGDGEHVSEDEFFFPLNKDPAVDRTEYPDNRNNGQSYYGPFGQARYRFEEMVKQQTFYYRCLAIAFPSGFHVQPPGKGPGASTAGEEIDYDTGERLSTPPATGYDRKLEGATNDTFVNWTGLLNPNPKEASYTLNDRQGTINYSITFDSRTFDLVPGSSKESIQVEDDYARRDYAATNILGGNAVIQDRGTYTLPSRTVTYSAKFRPQRNKGSRFPYIPNTTYAYIYTALDQFNPNRLNPQSVPDNKRQNYYYYSWIGDESESVDLINGTVNKSVTWNYELRYTNYNYFTTPKKDFFAAGGVGYAGMRIGNPQSNYPSIPTPAANPYG